MNEKSKEKRKRKSEEVLRELADEPAGKLGVPANNGGLIASYIANGFILGIRVGSRDMLDEMRRFMRRLDKEMP